MKRKKKSSNIGKNMIKNMIKNIIKFNRNFYYKDL